MINTDTLLSLPRRIAGFTDPVLEARFMELGILMGESVRVISTAPFDGAHRVETSRGIFGLRKEEWSSLLFDN